MNKHLVLALSLIVAAASQGCATTSPTINAARVPFIADNVQDRTQIEGWFGSPEEVERVAGASGCVEAWHWSHPTHTTFENLTVYFNTQGVVCGHSYSGVRARRAVGWRLASSGDATPATRY